MAEAAFEEGSVVVLKSGQRGVEQLALRDDDDVVTTGDVVTTENLSDQSFSSIPLDGTTELACGRDAETADLAAVRQEEDGREATVDAGPALVHVLKFRAATDALFGAEPQPTRR